MDYSEKTEEDAEKQKKKSGTHKSSKENHRYARDMLKFELIHYTPQTPDNHISIEYQYFQSALQQLDTYGPRFWEEYDAVLMARLEGDIK